MVNLPIQNLRTAKQGIRILNIEKNDSSPRFTFGFRYVKVEKLNEEELSVKFHSRWKRDLGTSSHKELNQQLAISDESKRFLSIPTDCPQRTREWAGLVIIQSLQILLHIIWKQEHLGHFLKMVELEQEHLVRYPFAPFKV